MYWTILVIKQPFLCLLFYRSNQFQLFWLTLLNHNFENVLYCSSWIVHF